MKLDDIEVKKERPHKVFYDNWRRPNEEELRLEFYIKQKKPSYIQMFRNMGVNIFDSWDKFKKAIDSAKEIRLTLEHDYRVARRSFTSSIEELKELTSTYRYPRDPDRIAQGYINNDQIPMPLILRIKDKDIIIAGNTRLDVARIMNMHPNPKVLIVPGRV